jgi:PilZ domain
VARANESTENESSETGLLTGKLVHLALPVRWSLLGQEGRGHAEMACTYDIHPRGARLLSSREVSVGDLLTVERGRSKAVCRVVWAADPASPLRGQFTVECVDEGRTPWDDELRQMQTRMEEQYQPVILDGLQRRAWATGFGRGDQNRRRRPRFYVEGQAEVIDGQQRADGQVQQLSEYGARIATTELLRPGTDFRLMLNVFDISMALKAKVKYLVDNLGMGVEFQEIRRGDRPLLSHVLSRLKGRRVEEFAGLEVEVVSDRLVAAAG